MSIRTRSRSTRPTWLRGWRRCGGSDVCGPRAVIGVDLFGQPADWPALRAIAAAENLFTLDDCAQSFGCSLHGVRLGTAADATATSFFPSKPLGAYGDGGALFTESAERAALFRSLRTHGEGTTRYEVLRTGMNGRLDSLQAAVLLSKLTVFADELAARSRIAAPTTRASRTRWRCPRACPTAPAPGRSTPSCCRTRGARPHAGRPAGGRGAHGHLLPAPPAHQPAYREAHDGTHLPIAEDISTRILALPIHPDLTDADVDRICSAVCANA